MPDKPYTLLNLFCNGCQFCTVVLITIPSTIKWLWCSSQSQMKLYASVLQSNSCESGDNEEAQHCSGVQFLHKIVCSIVQTERHLHCWFEVLFCYL